MECYMYVCNIMSKRAPAKKRNERPMLHRIKEVLASKKKTAYWLANETGISFNSIYAYVNNRVDPPLATLFLIADKLEIDPKELINS